MVKKAKFEWRILLTKFGKNLIYVVLAGLASIYGSNQYYLAIAPLLMAIENYLKHATKLLD